MSELSDDTKVEPGQPIPVKQRKLGRGLGALMGDMRRDEAIVRLSPIPPEEREQAATSQTREDSDRALKNIPISSISPLPGQPRTHFEESALAELAESIRARGVIQPIIVRPRGDRHLPTRCGRAALAGGAESAVARNTGDCP